MIVRVQGAPELRELLGADEVDVGEAPSAGAGLRALFEVPGAEDLVRAGAWSVRVDGLEVQEAALGAALARPARSLELRAAPTARFEGPAAVAPWVYWTIVGATLAATAYSIATLPSVRDYADREEPGNRQRHLFSGPVNSVEQGGPVPLVFGTRVRVGSVVVSASTSSDLDETGGGGDGGIIQLPQPSRQIGGGAGRPETHSVFGAVLSTVRTEEPPDPGPQGPDLPDPDDDDTGTDPPGPGDRQPGDPPTPDRYAPAKLDGVSRVRIVEMLGEGKIEGLRDPGVVLTRSLILSGAAAAGEAVLKVFGSPDDDLYDLDVSADDDGDVLETAACAGCKVRIDRGAAWLAGAVQSVTAAGKIRFLREGGAGALTAGAGAAISFPDEENRLASVFLDGTPLRTAAGQYNFSGVVDLELLRGGAGQTGLDTIDAVETQQQVDVALGTAATSRNRAGQADAVRVTLRAAALWRELDGDIAPARVLVEITIGSKTWGYRLQEKRTSPGEVSVVLPLGSETSVKVRRTTVPAADPDTVRDEVRWASVTWIRHVRQTYQSSALVGLTLDADRMGGRLPARSYEIAGLEVGIPSGWNRRTRAYPPVWSRTMAADPAAVDNPAWILFGLLRNVDWGIGAEPGMRAAAWAARDAFYEFGRWCDQSVALGAESAMEPRWRFNAAFSRRMKARRLLKLIESACRCGIEFQGGQLSLYWDADADPAAMLGDANVQDGEFEYGSRAPEWHERASVVAVTFNDPDDGFRASVELVISRNLIEKYGWRQRDVTAMGCTSRGQAHRIGRLLLYEQEHEAETFSCTATWDNALVRPGQVVQVADSDVTTSRTTRRVVEAAAVDGRLVLDQAVSAADAALIRSLWVRRLEGEASGDARGRKAGLAQYRTADGYRFGAGGATWGLSVSRAGGTAVPLRKVQGVVQIELATAGRKPLLYRVTEVRRVDTIRYRISGHRHQPGKYGVVESRRALGSPEKRISTGLKPLKAVTLREEDYEDGALGTLAKVVVGVESAEADPRQRALDIQIRYAPTSAAAVADTPWRRLRTREVAPSRVGWYQARGRWVGGGTRSGWRESAVLHADGPGDVLGGDPTVPQWAMVIDRTVRAPTAAAVDLATEWHLSGAAGGWGGSRTVIIGGVSSTEEARLKRLAPGSLLALFDDLDNWLQAAAPAAPAFSGAGAARNAAIALEHVRSKGAQPSAGPLSVRFFPSGLDGPDLATIASFTLSPADPGMVLGWAAVATKPDLWKIQLGLPAPGGGVNYAGQPSYVDGAKTRLASGDPVVSGAAPPTSAFLAAIYSGSQLDKRLYARIQGVRRDGAAVVGYGADVASAVIEISTLSAPSLVATPGNALIVLTWSPVPGATGYEIFRNTTGTQPDPSTSPTWSTGDVARWVNTGLANGTRYYYWIRATTSAAASSLSPRASAVPTAGTAVIAPHFPSSSVAVAITRGAVGSQVLPAASGSAPAYALPGLPSWLSFSASTRRLSWTASAVVGTRTLTLTATNAAGADTLAVNVTVGLSAPSLDATPGNALIVLTWSPVPGATGYQIFRNTTGTQPDPSTSRSWRAGATVQWVNTGLANGTRYYYWVRATAGGSASSLSPRASAVPTAGTAVIAPHFPSSSVAVAITRGAAGSQVLPAASGSAPAYALPGLPSWLSFSASRRLSWTASAVVGTWPLTLTATNAAGADTLAVNVTVAGVGAWTAWQSAANLAWSADLDDADVSSQAAETDNRMWRWDTSGGGLADWSGGGLWAGASTFGVMATMNAVIDGAVVLVQVFQCYGTPANNVRRTDTDVYLNSEFTPLLFAGDLDTRRSESFDFTQAVLIYSASNRPSGLSSTDRAIGFLRWRRDLGGNGAGTQELAVVPGGFGSYRFYSRRWEL